MAKEHGSKPAESSQSTSGQSTNPVLAPGRVQKKSYPRATPTHTINQRQLRQDRNTANKAGRRWVQAEREAKRIHGTIYNQLISYFSRPAFGQPKRQHVRREDFSAEAERVYQRYLSGENAGTRYGEGEKDGSTGGLEGKKGHNGGRKRDEERFPGSLDDRMAEKLVKERGKQGASGGQGGKKGQSMATEGDEELIYKELSGEERQSLAEEGDGEVVPSGEESRETQTSGVDEASASGGDGEMGFLGALDGAERDDRGDEDSGVVMFSPR